MTFSRLQYVNAALDDSDVHAAVSSKHRRRKDYTRMSRAGEYFDLASFQKELINKKVNRPLTHKKDYKNIAPQEHVWYFNP